MKNGNLKIVASMLALGYAVGLAASVSRKKIELLSNTDNRKYVNRLKEFFFDEDYSKAVKKYYKFIESGLSGQNSFDILISPIQLTEIPIGEFND